jgi:hypothetical protein
VKANRVRGLEGGLSRRAKLAHREEALREHAAGAVADHAAEEPEQLRPFRVDIDPSRCCQLRVFG